MIELMPERNVASWNDIAAYAQNNHYDEALKSICQM